MPRRTGKKPVLMKKICLEKLNLDDVFCIVCRCIYLEPVTMPCGHTLCLECFKNMVELTSYQCHTCRMRLSNWLRKYKHDWSSLVNEKLWEALQLQYPVEVQKRLNGEDDGIEEHIARQGLPRVEIQEGEIKKEFDKMVESFQEEENEKELQTLELAKQLQEVEELNLQAKKAEEERLTQDDVKLALAIQEQMQKELEQEEENNFCLALELQKKISSELKKPIAKSSIKTIKTSPKLTIPKKGPLDKIITRFGFKSDQSSSCEVADTSTNSSVVDPCSSSTSMNPCTSLSVANLTTNTSFKNSGIFDCNDNLNTCTCGRLKENINSDITPCQFCKDQTALLDDLVTQKNDHLMAKKLQESFSKENFDAYNLRKRSASPTKKLLKSVKDNKH